jgi:hypothetical protein
MASFSLRHDEVDAIIRIRNVTEHKIIEAGRPGHCQLFTWMHVLGSKTVALANSGVQRERYVSVRALGGCN